jgi:hypothetical protein
MVIWEKQIVSPFRNADIGLRLPPNGFKERFKPIGVRTRVVEAELGTLREPDYSMRLASYLVASVGEGSTFKICEWLTMTSGSVIEGLQTTRSGTWRRIEMVFAVIRMHVVNS